MFCATIYYVHGKTYFHKYLCFNLADPCRNGDISYQTICVSLSGFSLLVCVFVSLLFIELILCDPIMIIDGYAESPLSPGSLTACSVGRLTASVDSLYNPDLVLRYTRQVMMFTIVAPGMPMLHRITNGTELTWKRIKKSR